MQPLAPMPEDLKANFTSYQIVIDTKNLLANSSFMGKEAARVFNSMQFLATLENEYAAAVKNHAQFSLYFPSEVKQETKVAAATETVAAKEQGAPASDSSAPVSKAKKAQSKKAKPATTLSGASGTSVSGIPTVKRTRGRPRKITALAKV